LNNTFMPPQKRISKKKKKNIADKLKILFIVFLLALSVFAVLFYFIRIKWQEPTNFNKEKFQVRGVDLSHHNPIINWSELQGHNISFAYLKATGGVSHLDRNYPYNYKAVKDNRIRVGSYHFYLFAASGKEQARHFINTAKCEQGDLLPAIDVEHSPDNPYSKDTAFVSIVVNELKILENELYEYYGYHPVIYTNKDCYKLYVKDNFPSNYIWMCDLHKEPSDIDNWIIWQFSHKGQLEGVDSELDLNYFRYSYDQINKILIP